MKAQFNWNDVLKIAAALAISGFVWTQDNQTALLTLASMGIVWGVKVYAIRTGKYIGKAWLTSILLGLSVGFAYLFHPVTFPAIPAFNGDVLAFMPALFAWFGALLATGKEVFALATGLYNVLLGKVLEKAETFVLPMLKSGKQ